MHYFKNLSKRFSSKKNNNIIGKQIKAVNDEQKIYYN